MGRGYREGRATGARPRAGVRPGVRPEVRPERADWKARGAGRLAAAGVAAFVACAAALLSGCTGAPGPAPASSSSSTAWPTLETSPSASPGDAPGAGVGGGEAGGDAEAGGTEVSPLAVPALGGDLLVRADGQIGPGSIEGVRPRGGAIAVAVACRGEGKISVRIGGAGGFGLECAAASNDISGVFEIGERRRLIDIHVDAGRETEWSLAVSETERKPGAGGG
ncbi:hypothetical protein ACQ3I4_00105 [Zafaria sp. Z1313]|uniref:hypothetical protein n=1 Tax=Zafaria sp. Z1313 TaxID=3423202 RepID=UPI003D303BA4